MVECLYSALSRGNARNADRCRLMLLQREDHSQSHALALMVRINKQRICKDDDDGPACTTFVSGPDDFSDNGKMVNGYSADLQSCDAIKVTVRRM